MFQFWREFGGWFNDVFNCTFKLGCLDNLFGAMDKTNDDMLCVLNYCILFAKNKSTNVTKFKK